jgi:parallel beta-helix repeat protein
MVKRFLFLGCFFSQQLFSVVVTVNVNPGDVLNWNTYSSLGASDTLEIVLSNPAGQVQLLGTGEITVRDTIVCNGTLRITSTQIDVTGSVEAPGIIVEANKIRLRDASLLDASGASGGGSIYVGGGWLGQDPNIKNASVVQAYDGCTIRADGTVNGPGGIVVLWSEKATAFLGSISATGAGVSPPGGQVEVSSHRYLIFDGSVDVSAQSGNSGTIALDPLSITIQAASPDINGNGSNLDITFTTQLDNATTTPAGFPNANSIITAGALNSLLTTNTTMTLAAQSFITVNAAITAPGNNVTLTMQAPTVNLNATVTLPGGGTLQGSGVTTVNVGPSGSPQNGVDVSNNGATVNLSTATYLGPINIINKNITLNGNGQSNTTILNPPGGVPLQGTRNPIVYVNGGTNAVIQNLTVDGNFIGFPTNANILGIYYRNAGGTVDNVHVTKVANSPPPYGGGQQGGGVRTDITAGGPFSMTISNSTFDFFQKAAIATNGTPLTVNIFNNTITGLGTTSTPSAIGIQVASGATGTVSGNDISGIQFTDHATANGILLFSAGAGLVVSGNTVSDCDEGILSLDAGDGLVIQNNTVTNSGDTGIVVLDTNGNTQITSNTLTNNGGLAGPSAGNTGIYLFSSTTQTFDVNQNSIMPAPGTSAIFTQGSGAGAAPDASFFDNTFIDP